MPYITSQNAAITADMVADLKTVPEPLVAV